jgi:effector-binding domain-containing protein
MNFFLKPGLCIAAAIVLYGFSVKSRNGTANASLPGVNKIALQQPSFTIEELPVAKQTVVYVTDSAGSVPEITQKFMKIIPFELGGFLKKNSLKMASPPMAWYNGNKAPFIFDIGVAVNAGAATEGRIKIREIAAGNSVVAHFYGPYDQTAKAYPAVETYIKEHKKIANGAPYEIYKGDPGTETDPYKVLTDIVFPVK